jgi:hypothetical protein
MARTKGAKGQRKTGTVAGGRGGPWVWFDQALMQEYLRDRKLLPLTQCGADTRTLRLLRSGKQPRLREPVFVELCRRLKVPPADLVTSGTQLTGVEFRVDVTARALSTDFWKAAQQGGGEPPWLHEMFRWVLHFDTWSGALWDGGTPVLSTSSAGSWRIKKGALTRVENRRRQFCDRMAEVLRMLLPSTQDAKHGVSISTWRSGALVGAFRDGGLRRLQRAGSRSSAVSRAAAKTAAARAIAKMGGARLPTKGVPMQKKRAMIRST